MHIKLLTIAAVSFLIQCAIGPTNGMIYTKNAFPGEFNSNNDVPITKRAIDCQRSILGMVGWGQAGAGRIAFENGISRIASIDHSTTNIFIFAYRSYCTIVSGESIKTEKEIEK